jgi:hypothetical protein
MIGNDIKVNIPIINLIKYLDTIDQKMEMRSDMSD